MLPLFAVTVRDAGPDLQHATTAGGSQTLCGRSVPRTERVFGRFPAVHGTLCGTCVDTAYLPSTRGARPVLRHARCVHAPATVGAADDDRLPYKRDIRGGSALRQRSAERHRFGAVAERRCRQNDGGYRGEKYRTHVFPRCARIRSKPSRAAHGDTRHQRAAFSRRISCAGV